MIAYVVRERGSCRYLRWQADCGGWDIEAVWGDITNATLFTQEAEAEEQAKKHKQDVVHGIRSKCYGVQKVKVDIPQ